jgi:DNA mismatch repair ATPase MutS
MEMKETAFICNSTKEKSLFLLDELGRATSNEDGVAVMGCNTSKKLENKNKSLDFGAL